MYLALISALLEPTANLISALLEPTANLISALLEPTANLISALLEPTANLISALLEPTANLISALLEPTANLISALLEPTANLISALLEPTANLISALLEPTANLAKIYITYYRYYSYTNTKILLNMEFYSEETNILVSDNKDPLYQAFIAQGLIPVEVKELEYFRKVRRRLFLQEQDSKGSSLS